MLDSYQLLRFAHVLLFAYWLGADLGVFLAGGVMSRPGLPVPERNRVRSLLMDIDLAPRIALIGMLPVGFQLALSWGAPLPGRLGACRLAAGGRVDRHGARDPLRPWATRTSRAC